MSCVSDTMVKGNTMEKENTMEKGQPIKEGRSMKEGWFMDKGYLRVQFFMIAVVMLGLFFVAAKPCIWFDESFTINLIRRRVPDLIRLTALDVHPPLYYLVVRLCTLILGENTFSLYLTSILCHGALLAATALFFHRFFTAELSLLVTAALCALPNMLVNALQLRMYSMAMLFVTVSFYLTYIVLACVNAGDRRRRNRFLLLLALSNVLAAYTHYFAGVAAVGISLFVLVGLLAREDNRGRAFLDWCIYCCIMILLYLPWLPALLKQMSAVHEDYWITPVTQDTLRSYWLMLFNVQSEQLQRPLMVFFLVGILLFLSHFTWNRRNAWIMGCYFVLAVWFAFGIGYSWLRTPILIDRYLLVVLPLVWIPVLSGYARAAGKWIWPAALLFLAVCFVHNYEDMYQEHEEHSQKGMRDYISVNASGDDIFFHYDIQALSMCEAYFPEMEHCVISGADSGQAFRHWPELLDCSEVDSVKELSDVDGNIWCLNESCVLMFEDMGFQVESIDLDSQVIFRIHK